jgi:vacuolar protein sorting-associated protein 13A/C
MSLHFYLPKIGTAEPTVDTFSEKLITQIIKNVQIRIESIHIRYEDSVTKPKQAFAFGAILKSLHVQTTDKDWKLAIIAETVQTIYKVILEGT